MKRIFMFALAAIIFLNFGCTNNDFDTPPESLDFRQEMRNFVIGISDYSHSKRSDFLIVPQNGMELITTNGDPSGALEYSYLEAIDANAQEDLLYGYDDDNIDTPAAVKKELQALLDISLSAKNKILVVDYCWTDSKVANSYTENRTKNYISFAAPSRELDIIPNYQSSLINENKENITSLNDAKNFLYLLNYDRFSNKMQLLTALSKTNYDVLILDAFFEQNIFSSEEINLLKTKQNGGARLVVSYMSIGEAETYRYYWDTNWKSNAPEWLSSENPEWTGNFKVKYWNKEWQKIIYGSESSYVDKIILAGFDGVYLDIIDAYEYFE